MTGKKCNRFVIPAPCPSVAFGEGGKTGIQYFMKKKKSKSKKEKIIRVVVEKRSEPLRVPDLEIPDYLDANKYFCND